MAQRKPEERRDHLRVDVDLPVEEFHEGAVYYQRATNLSLAGLYLDRTLPHPPGTRVRLALALADGDAPLLLDAEVVEALRGEGMGVRFVEVDRERRTRLANFLLTQHA